jgi:hypothetical protein
MEGFGDYVLILESAVEQKQMEVTLNGTAYFFLNMTLVQGKNIFVASLYDNETRVATALFTLYVINGMLITDGNAAEVQNQSMLSSVTGRAVISAPDNYYKTLSSVHAIVLLSILLFVIMLLLLKTPEKNMLKKFHKLFKTTLVSSNHEESHQSTSDYRDVGCPERAH